MDFETVISAIDCSSVLNSKAADSTVPFELARAANLRLNDCSAQAELETGSSVEANKVGYQIVVLEVAESEQMIYVTEL